MYRKLVKYPSQIIENLRSKYEHYQRRYLRVTLIGSTGGTAEPLSMFLKLNPLVTELLLYDKQASVIALAADLSQIDTGAVVQGFTGRDIDGALSKTDIVVLPAGAPLGSNRTPDQLFTTNAKLTYEIADRMTKHTAQPILAIAMDPTNSIVPLAAEVLERGGKDPYKVLGMTTLDVIRATKLVAEYNCMKPEDVHVPVIGGREGITIIPVLSQCKPPVKVSHPCMIEELTKKIQEGVTKKEGHADPKLTTAYAMARFTDVLLRGLAGQSGVVENAFVKSDKTDAPFFGNSVLLGKNGVEKNLGFGILSDYEKELVQAAVPVLCDHAKVGIKFVKKELGYV